VGLYDLEVVSPWGCYFWTGGLAYDTDNLNKLVVYSVIEIIANIFMVL